MVLQWYDKDVEVEVEDMPFVNVYYVMLWVLSPTVLLVSHTCTFTTLYLYCTLMPPI